MKRLAEIKLLPELGKFVYLSSTSTKDCGHRSPVRNEQTAKKMRKKTGAFIC